MAIPTDGSRVYLLHLSANYCDHPASFGEGYVGQTMAWGCGDNKRKMIRRERHGGFVVLRLFRCWFGGGWGRIDTTLGLADLLEIVACTRIGE